MIVLKMNKLDYENDIRALLMAFFYGEKIVYESTDWSIFVEVIYTQTDASFSIKDKNYKSCSDSMVCNFSEYKATKNDLKRMVYKVLVDFTGHGLPWGTLTGIRPTKLSMDIFEHGGSDADSISYLKDNYYVTDEKAALCTQVARNEYSILNSISYKDSYSLYVGIPFCPSICAYCSFSSYPLSAWADQVDVYLDALEKEIAAAADMMGDRKLLSFYMGGGTPTSLNAKQMDRLLGSIKKHFPIWEARERTVEAGRPDSITSDKLDVIKAHNVERISINPQTMNQDTLDLIGRRHTVDDVYKAFEMARDIGFKNINMDLIAGLPGETSRQMQKTMDAVVGLAPDSVTVHSLALKRAAFLNQNREKFPVADAKEVNNMIGITHRGADAINAKPYYLYRQKNIAGNLENVGYARSGCEGIYNILIMEEKQSILALGTGAASKFVFENNAGTRIERVENVKSVKDYILRIDEMIARKQNFLNKEQF